MTRVPGHELVREGEPYDAPGKRSHPHWFGTSGTGKAMCSCGELSEVLDSGNKRKAWHRAHKVQVTETRAASGS